MATPSARRMLGFWSATSIVVGGIIGSGVFMKPATMRGTDGFCRFCWQWSGSLQGSSLYLVD